MTMSIRNVTCGSCLKQIEFDLDKANLLNRKTETKEKNRRQSQVKAKKLINSLPDIFDLREYAWDLHENCLKLWVDVSGAETSENYMKVVKYGFTLEAWDHVKQHELSLLPRLMKLESECNCKHHEPFGDTLHRVLDGTWHHTWCNMAREFNEKYYQLLEKKQ